MDGRGYPSYKGIRGEWSGPGFTLVVDHVQGDPFAAPSRVRLLIPAATAGLDPWLLEGESRRLGVAAWLARGFADEASGRHGGGSGKSGTIAMASPGQLVVRQTAVQIDGAGNVEARIVVGLPARGRRVMGREAARLLTEVVPGLVEGHLVAAAHDPQVLRRAAAVNEDAYALRAALEGAGLVSFIADGAVLPRESGASDRPMPRGALPFQAPASLRVALETPNAGPVHGMGIPLGVTLIVGGGFHGKSTLLQAVEAGVYNHRPGDGREQVVTADSAVRIRAEEGRSVVGVDISPFIGNLPDGQDTRSFSTANASGSTSQAAGLVEALELGAGALLMDEDTCATNFLIRDRRMQELVPPAREPITPLVDRVRWLYEEEGVSSVIVLGGSGDYLDVADTVVGMDAYRAVDLTDRAREVAEGFPTGRITGEGAPAPAPGASRGGTGRRLGAGSLPAGRKGRDPRVRVMEGRVVRVGDVRLELAALDQLPLPSQLNTVAAVLEAMGREPGWEGLGLPEWARQVSAALASDLDRFDARIRGDLAEIRPFEVAAALNRLRGLTIG